MSKLKIVTSFQTLLHLAREQYLAERSGDEEKIKIATEKHYAYKKLCLESDEMIIGALNV